MFPMQSMQDKRGDGRADAVRVSERLPPASPRCMTRGTLGRMPQLKSARN